MAAEIHALGERLFRILSREHFLLMKGLANEVPLFIQAYDPAKEDAVRRMVNALTSRLRAVGITVAQLDLLDMVLKILERHGHLADLLAGETTFTKAELFETLHNYADPKAHLVPELLRTVEDGSTQLTLLTGAGRVYPFLRTHTILESLQPAMLRHPVVLFFPGEYTQEPGGGSHLRLFGSLPSPQLTKPY
jgi:hypothetical protein